MGALLFGRGVPRLAWAGAFGGLTPDVPMLVIVLALKLSGVSTAHIFGELYWEDWWQITNAIGHSFVLWTGLLVLGFILHTRATVIFAGSALLHSCIDFLVHRDDAHMSLWPITRWKFVSPVSYYDPAHYGFYFSLFEAALGLCMAALLFRQYSNWVLRGTLCFAMLIYVAVPAYFIFLRT